MKYIVILGDGMADEPLEQLGGKTPLEYAQTPAMDALAALGEVGRVQNIPPGMVPGSDVANLSVLGFDPRVCYTGRAPLEAMSLGIPMEEGDVILRCNLVTLSEAGDFAEKIILDHSAGELSTAQADVLMDAVRERFDSEEFRFYTGTGYRQICVWKGGVLPELTAPYDCLGKAVGPYLPAEEKLRTVMERSFSLLNNHPMNRTREKKANSLWFWGGGTRPALENFTQKTGLRGAMISAVDLLKGIAVAAGMDVIPVPGATGLLDTNYEGKAVAAVQALKNGWDFVYVHVEGPDEMGHQGNAEKKVEAIRRLDQRLIGPLKAAMEDWGEAYRMLILPDHPTPVRLRHHTAEAVPYVLFDSTRPRANCIPFSETEAKRSDIFHPQGWEMLKKLLQQ